ncbi:N/A [soil metagenome]
MLNDVRKTTVRLDRLSPEKLSPMFTQLDLTDAQGVNGHYEMMECADMTFVRATTCGGLFHVHRREAHLMSAPSTACFICLPLHGEAQLSQHGRDCALGAGDLGLLDAQSPYSVEISSGCDALWIRFPKQRFDWRSHAFRGVSARKISGSAGLGLLTSNYIRTLFDQMSSVPSSSRQALGATMVDLIGEAALEATNGVRPFKPASRRTFERAQMYIERHICDEDLSPKRIAEGLGISQRYLSDLFAAEGQTTMGHVVQRRLERCHEALMQEEWRPGIITQLVFDHGFVNLSSFNRSFKAAYGVTPRQVMPNTPREAVTS